MDEIVVSALPKTWILDIDGTLLRHNGHLSSDGDQLLPHVPQHLSNIGPEDMVVLITSRKREYEHVTEAVLAEAGVRWDHIIWGAPYGERILVNDSKPSGLRTAVAINVPRDLQGDVHIRVGVDL